ncbi:MAG TPA: LacI family DNA-binding transcriptional regulator [Tepidisphaeraceae bacterium]|jgi:LacI family transcriptional regulator|nr:LacI family DNA-binding transcriptional regulator [Tepidisphaeraceae bacterium]
MRVTVSDIAAATGLSKPTVARVLRDASAPFRAETRERVMEAARRLGYRPNAAAKAINSGRFDCAVLVMGTDPGRSFVPMGVINGIQAELVTHDMHLAVTRMPDQQLSDPNIVPKVLRQNMADGIIVNYTHEYPPELAKLMEWSGAPAVWLNTKRPNDAVRPDDELAGRMATEKLLALGHRRIAYLHMSPLAVPLPHYSAGDRIAGYSAVMAAAGLSPRVLHRQVSHADQPAAARAFVTGSDRPTAIIAGSDGNAVHAIYEAVHAGLSVPGQVSVVAISDEWDLFAAGLRVSSFAVHGRHEGEAAVRLLVEKIRVPSTAVATVAVPFEERPGETIARSPEV